ncbi:ATP-binding protein [Roseibium sp. RKSG952]|uniref:ATP-binding protein n=1 Tax=Roseibium sp. RKSG952 TaxID=2529384 RepID=UPI0012BB976C|nr:ATP-binding protein [Roseibium sp. RKSG952]MTH95285.1 hypothetical protein [Roseibium sp. RKSG952]
MDRRQIETPKSFFIKERDQFYSDWLLSFWREFFQNSVDAGSKNIDIEIEKTGKRGSFDEPGNSEREVTRIVFSDDGCGMTKDVLDDVYFAIGASTKDDESTIGGFGRARLMTCFSQDRYSIMTGDRFVLGDGPNFVNMDLSEAIEKLAEINDSHLRIKAEHNGHTIRDIDQDIYLLKKFRAAGGNKGCRVEVDLDPESGGRFSGIPTVENMKAKLKEYLSESQLSANVTINGKSPEKFFESEIKIRTIRGPAKRALSARPEEDADPVEFATVHTSEGRQAAHKGKIIVRVDGASMFTEPLSDERTQVIIELKREYARQAMNSNRDSLRGPYKKVVRELIAELTVDNRSALEEKKAKEHFTIPGELGRKVAARPNLEKHIGDKVEESELGIIEKIKYAEKKTDKHEIRSEADLLALGLTTDVFGDFVNSAVDFGNTFMDRVTSEDDPEITYFFGEDYRKAKSAAAAESKYLGNRVNAFLEASSDDLTRMIVEVIKTRMAAEQKKTSEENARKLADFTDVTVKVISTNPKTRQAMRRNDPRKWDEVSGRGRTSKTLLSAWTAACSVAVETLMKTHPNIGSFDWNVGWVYSAPEKKWDGDVERTVNFSAMCVRNGYGSCSFLLNPVNPDGTLRYKTSSLADRQRLQALAMHEVAHVVEGPHNETYAGVLTDLMQEYDFAEANRRMKESAKAVYAAFERGKASVQAMDDEPGPRPAERLMSLSNGYVEDSALDLTANGASYVDCDEDKAQIMSERPIQEPDEEYDWQPVRI